MDKNKIKKEYHKKVKILLKLNKHYYDLSKPLVNDNEYDQIKTEILSLEKKYFFLKSKNSPSKIQNSSSKRQNSVSKNKN